MTALRGATRWSMLARCARQAWYAYQGEEPEPFDEKTKRRIRRGKLDEQVIVEELRERYGHDQIVTQKAVPWPDEGLPLGELHQDAFVVPEKLPVEIKSHAGGEPSEHDWIQLAGQVMYDPEADGAGLLMIVDRDLEVTAYPLVLTDGLRAEVSGRVAELAAGIESRLPPERCCAKPSEARGRFCPFAAVCFEGWTPPEAVAFDEPELALRALHAKRAYDEAKGSSEEAEREWREAREALLVAGLPEGESTCGPISIRRKHVGDSERVSLAKIRASGVPWPDELYAPFVTFSGGHDRVSVERTGDEPVEIEFGSVPF